MTQAYSRGPSIYQGGRGTLYIIVACVAAFFLQKLFPLLTTQWLSLIPAKALHGQVWRLFTYMFMHGDFAHIFFNMMGLFFFGPVLERTFGHKRFLQFYFLCGVGAGAVSVFFYFSLGAADAHIIGASGAIFGVLAAYGILFPNSTVYLNFILPIKAKWLVLIYGAMELLATFQYAGGGRSGIASIAHLSGMVIAYFYIRGFFDGKRLWLKYKYWRADRERKKHFKVIDGDRDHTIH